ncbi:hypothetical protein [Micromonospora sp. NPDC051006]|uniref:hypothetical protein n=1 Tax=Micromonospora sp. NPDC051006 TaxID=3364283 RepID=UPI0037A36A9D
MAGRPVRRYSNCPPLTIGLPARTALAELRGRLGTHGWTLNAEMQQVVEAP